MGPDNPSKLVSHAWTIATTRLIHGQLLIDRYCPVIIPPFLQLGFGYSSDLTLRLDLNLDSIDLDLTRLLPRPEHGWKSVLPPFRSDIPDILEPSTGIQPLCRRGRFQVSRCVLDVGVFRVVDLGEVMIQQFRA